MPSLRQKQPSPPLAPEPIEAICVEGFRPAIGPLIERGLRLPIDSPYVQRFPQYFMGLVALTPKEVNDGK
jgi:hypothetical protein